MANRPIDLDTRQSLRDVFFTPNRYALDERFVLRDGKRHPLAVIVPGGGYGMVCSFIEGTPVARKLNELGISAFIVYYRTRKKARYPAPQEDLARAIREILAKEGHETPDPYTPDPHLPRVGRPPKTPIPATAIRRLLDALYDDLLALSRGEVS